MVQSLRPRRWQSPQLEEGPPNHKVTEMSKEEDQQPPMREVNVNLVRVRLGREEQPVFWHRPWTLDRDPTLVPSRREGSQAQTRGGRDIDHRGRRLEDRDRDHHQ